MPTLPKPDYNGQFDGQVITLDVKVPKLKNGRVMTIPWTRPDGSTGRMVVKEVQCRVEWAWDGDRREWVTENVWKARRKGPNEGKITVSKHTDLHRQLAERQRRANGRLRRKKKNGGRR